MIAGKGPLQPALEALAAMQLGGLQVESHFTGFLSPGKSAQAFTTAAISSFIRAKCLADENQGGEFPIQSSKQWRQECRCSPPSTAEFTEAVESGRCGALVEERDA